MLLFIFISVLAFILVAYLIYNSSCDQQYKRALTILNLMDKEKAKVFERKMRSDKERDIFCKLGMKNYLIKNNYI